MFFLCKKKKYSDLAVEGREVFRIVTAEKFFLIPDFVAWKVIIYLSKSFQRFDLVFMRSERNWENM